MLTQAAARSLPDLSRHPLAVLSRRELARRGIGRDRISAQVAAHRWQLAGSAVVLHNGALGRQQRWRAALINCGPRSLLTAFTAAQARGLAGWDRPEVHVLAPAGTAAPALTGISVRLHRVRHSDRVLAHRGIHALAQAIPLAAGTFESVRPACGILAAAVQQRLITAAELRAGLLAATRLRHRAALLAVVGDIEQGSQALSEIDFYALCRRYRLPLPERQTVRTDRAGRRRYLDATWRRADGRLVVAEVDGAVHLNVSRWWDDQDRQNELSLDNALVLRFPSVVVRTQPAVVADQLRRALRRQ